jgi:hypothetical protein
MSRREQPQMKMESDAKLTSVLCGVAGEYFVAAELSRRGYVASLTLRNTRGIDILASNSDATKTIGIQVKTNQTDRPEWILNRKAEAEVAENLFYVFVRLNRTGSPAFHVVPRAIVANFVREEHEAWSKAPGKGGRAHGESSVRKFRDPSDQYLGHWEKLGLDELPAASPTTAARS